MGLSVRQDGRGVWWCRPYLGVDPQTGRPRRPYRRFPEARSEAEALEMAARWVAGLADPDLSHVLDAYVAHVADMGTPRGHGTRANTARAYRTHARRVARLLPGARVDELTPRQVTGLYRRMLAPRPAGEGLSASTVAGAHWFLCGALRWAVRQGYCDSSPMGAVDHPTAPPGASSTARALDEAEARELARLARDAVSRDGPWDAARRDALAVHLGLVTGMRVGEVAALRRRDRRASVPDLCAAGTVVRLPGGGLARQDAPKRGAAGRVSVTEADDALVALALEAQGPLGADAPVVTVGGGWADPRALNAALRGMCRELGLPGWVHFHTLRHTHATLLLLGGTNIRVVQERLRHADVATTLRLYGHVLPGRDAEAARAFGGLMGTD